MRYSEKELHYYANLLQAWRCVFAQDAGDAVTAAAAARTVITTRAEATFALIAPPRDTQIAALLRVGAGVLARDEVAYFAEQAQPSRRAHAALARCRALVAADYGDLVGALGYAKEAVEAAHAATLPGEVWVSEALRARLHTMQGEAAAAEAACDRARAVLADLAGGIPDAAQRAAFRRATKRRLTRTVNPD